MRTPLTQTGTQPCRLAAVGAWMLFLAVVWPAEMRLVGATVPTRSQPPNGSDSVPQATPEPVALSLTLIPPSPVTDQITLDVRGALRNVSGHVRRFEVSFYLDQEEESRLLHRQALEVPPASARGVSFRVPAQGRAGEHRIILVAGSGPDAPRASQPITILASSSRSTRRLGGAWVDIYHHDEGEGKPFNDDLAKMTEPQWRELVRAMHAADQDILVITMMFQNFTHRGRHQIEAEGYQGKAYYPSKLFPGRMPIASADPLEAILSEADRLGMHVLPGVGCYAFFDYTPASLSWHEQVAEELWERYGHHRSFYGWYVSAEKDGGLGDTEERREIVEFFRQFTPFVRRLAPDKPVMLAPNCYHLQGAQETYKQLLPNLDIVCPFGYHRMPEGDLKGEQAAVLMQALCDAAGTHLWMDLESFVFRNGSELHPRPIAGLISDFTRFPNFEKTLHYQFPGLMSARTMSRRPGGDASVRLYLDYQEKVQRGPAGGSPRAVRPTSDLAPAAGRPLAAKVLPAPDTEPGPAIIPAPVVLEPRKGTFQLRARSRILTGGDQSQVEETARYLAELLEPATGFHLDVKRSPGSGPAGSILLTTESAPARVGNEGYVLDVSPERVVLRANQAAGLFYGVQTLRELLPPEIMSTGLVKRTSWPTSCAHVEDWPRFQWRGFMLDSARKFQTTDWILGLLDELAAYKLNILHWHLTDDEGWRIPIPKYPDLVRPFLKGAVWMDEGFYTHAEIQRIVEYARRRHITIVPEIEMPGHCHCVVVNYPSLSPLEDPGRRSPDQPKYTYRCREINIGDPASLAFYQDVLKVVMDLFPSQVIHLGGDEAEVKNWGANPQCQAKMRELAFAEPALLQKWWMAQMSQWVRQQGRVSMAWGERMDLGLPPDGQIVHGWRGESGPAVRAGFRTVNSLHTYTYLDYGNGPGDGQLGHLPLQRVYAFDPIPAGASLEQARLVLGSTTPLWSTDVPQEKLYRRIFPRLLAFSEVVWTPQKQRGYSEFVARARAQVGRLDVLGVPHWNAVELSSPQKLVHAAVGRPVSYAIPPDSRYPDRGSSSLTDGQLADPDYQHPGWVGWEGEDMTALVDLGKTTVVRELAARFLQWVPAGIYLPTKVEFAVSRNGKDFAPAGFATGPTTDQTDPVAREFGSTNLHLQARFIRVHAVSLGRIPDGKPAAGAKAWLFVDEIVVNPL